MSHSQETKQIPNVLSDMVLMCIRAAITPVTTFDETESTALVKAQAGVAIKSVDQHSHANFFSPNVVMIIQMASNAKINRLKGTKRHSDRSSWRLKIIEQGQLKPIQSTHAEEEISVIWGSRHMYHHLGLASRLESIDDLREFTLLLLSVDPEPDPPDLDASLLGSGRGDLSP